MTVSQAKFIARVREGMANGETNDEVCDALGMKRGSFTAKLSQENAILKQTRESLNRRQAAFERVNEEINELVGVIIDDETQATSYVVEPDIVKTSSIVVENGSHVIRVGDDDKPISEQLAKLANDCDGETLGDLLDKIDATCNKITNGLHLARKMKLKSKGGGGATSTRATDVDDVLSMLESLE